MSSTVSAPVFDKKKHVLLIPDLFPIHMELLANVIRASGYRVEVLRTHGADVMEAGLKYIHNDMCYPRHLLPGPAAPRHHQRHP